MFGSCFLYLESPIKLRYSQHGQQLTWGKKVSTMDLSQIDHTCLWILHYFGRVNAFNVLAFSRLSGLLARSCTVSDSVLNCYALWRSLHAAPRAYQILPQIRSMHTLAAIASWQRQPTAVASGSPVKEFSINPWAHWACKASAGSAAHTISHHCLISPKRATASSSLGKSHLATPLCKDCDVPLHRNTWPSGLGHLDFVCLVSCNIKHLWTHSW